MYTGCKSIPEFSVANLLVLPLSHNDSGGERRKFSVIEQIQDKWEQAGILLGFKCAEFSAIQQQYHFDAKKCLICIIEKWIHTCNSTNGRYSPTWEGLAELLLDIDEVPMANELNKLLS